MKRGKRHWYHCTDRFMGERWTAERIAPRMHGADEPDTPRLCVCPTVGGCLTARLMGGDVFVYRTAKPRRANRPRSVHDAPITGERWLVPPVALELVEVLPGTILEPILGAVVSHVQRHNGMSAAARARLYRRVIQAIEPAGVHVPAWEKHLVAYANRVLNNDETPVPTEGATNVL